MQRACSHREYPAEQGKQGPSEPGEVQEAGPHPETREGHSRSFRLHRDVFISPVEEPAAG